MISKQTVYLNADRTKAVEEGAPDARFLLVREGHEISEAEVEKYGATSLLKGSKSEALAQNESPAPQNRESAMPKLRKRSKGK